MVLGRPSMSIVTGALYSFFCNFDILCLCSLFSGKTGALSAYDARRSRYIAHTHCRKTPLLQNGLVQLGRGSAVRQAIRLVPKWPKDKALSKLRSKKTFDSAEKQ